MRILLVEDNVPLGENLTEILTGLGYDVVHIYDAEAAQTSAAAQRFDLLLTDVRLPGASGLDLLGTLRGAGFRAPAIVMTAFPDEALSLAARALHVSEILEKPVRVESLIAAVTAAAPQLDREHRA